MTTAGVAVSAEAHRLSESTLWDQQRHFYESDVSTLWGSCTVPHHITANPRIANTYARLGVAFLQAAGATEGDDEAALPHVVEFGGGSGRLAYLLVRQLRELAPGLQFRYVLTDFSPERVAAWADHPSYRPLIDDDLLDFAVLDVERPEAMQLVTSGRTIASGSLTGPVMGIANYVFDTLRHDAYAVDAGDLSELRVSVAGDPGKWEFEWQAEPCSSLPPDIEPELDFYRETLDDTSVLVPVGGMRCLDYLDTLSSGPSCTLVADKGHRTPLDLCTQPEPAVVSHGEGFSMMVNFDLLARWVRRHKGLAVLPRDPARSLVVAAFARGELVNPAWFEAAVQDHLVDTGPDNYHLLRSRLTVEESPDIQMILAGLRLSRFDPALYIEMLPALLEVLPSVPDSMRSEIEGILLRVWDNYFPIGESADLALCIGLAFSAMERYPEAVDFLERSAKEHPESAPVAFAVAVARRGLRDLSVAHEWVVRALEIAPGFPRARALRVALTEEMGSVPRAQLV